MGAWPRIGPAPSSSFGSRSFGSSFGMGIEPMPVILGKFCILADGTARDGGQARVARIVRIRYDRRTELQHTFSLDADFAQLHACARRSAAETTPGHAVTPDARTTSLAVTARPQYTALLASAPNLASWCFAVEGPIVRASTVVVCARDSDAGTRSAARVAPRRASTEAMCEWGASASGQQQAAGTRG